MWGVCDRCILWDRRRCMWLTAYIASHVFPRWVLLLVFNVVIISVIFSVECVLYQTNEATLRVL